MTEEFKAMCQAVTEMAKEELDTDRDGSFLMYAHETRGEDDETVKAAFGKPADLCTAVVMSLLAMMERIPKAHRKPLIISTMMAALAHCEEDETEERQP